MGRSNEALEDLGRFGHIESCQAQMPQACRAMLEAAVPLALGASRLQQSRSVGMCRSKRRTS